MPAPTPTPAAGYAECLGWVRRDERENATSAVAKFIAAFLLGSALIEEPGQLPNAFGGGDPSGSTPG